MNKNNNFQYEALAYIILTAERDLKAAIQFHKSPEEHKIKNILYQMMLQMNLMCSYEFLKHHEALFSQDLISRWNAIKEIMEQGSRRTSSVMGEMLKEDEEVKEVVKEKLNLNDEEMDQIIEKLLGD